MSSTRAYQFNSRLERLLIVPRSFVLTPKNRTSITETRWRRMISEARRNETSDLRRHVRSKRHDLPRLRLDKPKDTRWINRPEAALKYVSVLEGRNTHLLVPVQFEHLEDAGGKLALCLRFGRKQISHARWQRVGQRSDRDGSCTERADGALWGNTGAAQSRRSLSKGAPESRP